MQIMLYIVFHVYNAGSLRHTQSHTLRHNLGFCTVLSLASLFQFCPMLEHSLILIWTVLYCFLLFFRGLLILGSNNLLLKAHSYFCPGPKQSQILILWPISYSSSLFCSSSCSNLFTFLSSKQSQILILCSCSSSCSYLFTFWYPNNSSFRLSVSVPVPV